MAQYTYILDRGPGVTIMGYQLRLHSQIRAWLTGLRDTEPEQARLVGEAMLALIDAGEALGPPLVVSLESVLGQPEDPRETLDRSYQHQLERLTQIRRGVADVATSRKRVELQIVSLEQNADKLARQRDEAQRAGREDLADVAAGRARAVVDQLSDLRRQYLGLYREEEKLTAASQRLQGKVEAFRTRKETLKATYTAAEASRSVREAMADLGEEAGDPEVPGEESFSSVTVRVTRFCGRSGSTRRIRRTIPGPGMTRALPRRRGSWSCARVLRANSGADCCSWCSPGHGGRAGLRRGSGRLRAPLPCRDPARGRPSAGRHGRPGR